MKQPLKTFPPYGRMVGELEERLGSGGPPDDWRSGVNWTNWRDNLENLIAAVLWPTYDFDSLTWRGAAAARIAGLTEADFRLFESLRPVLKTDVPNLAKPISHFAMFQLEDHPEDELEHDAGVDRGVDLTLRHYLEDRADQLTIDTLAHWIESGMMRKAGSLPVQVKRHLQRPRAFQVIDSLGESWFTHHQALQSPSPSMISGHAFKGCTLGIAGFYLATALGCTPRVFDALARLTVDFGDRRVFAGVHYPSDNLGSSIAAMLICEHVCADGGRLGRAFLWQAISTKSTVYGSIADAIGKNLAPDHKPAFNLLNQLGENADMGIDEALACACAEPQVRPKPESLAVAAE